MGFRFLRSNGINITDANQSNGGLSSRVISCVMRFIVLALLAVTLVECAAAQNSGVGVLLGSSSALAFQKSGTKPSPKPAPRPAPKPAAKLNFGNTASITPQRLRAHLEFIASDEMEGRDTPSRGLDIATLYLATQLKIWGAEPAGDNGTYFQNIALTTRSIDRAASTLEFADKKFLYGTSLQAATAGISGEGGLVYAGHGYVIKSKGIDPYAKASVKGRFVVISSGLPQGVSFTDLRAEGSERPAQAAKARGALGIIIIADKRANDIWDPNRIDRRGQMQPEMEGNASSRVGTITVSKEVASLLFEGESVSVEAAMSGENAPETPFVFTPTKRLKVNIVEQVTSVNTRNVVAVIPGSDPKMKNEYVAYGAHSDHVGMRTGGSGDQIYNGADDDGSGTVAILEIAHALLTGSRPKRPSLFVWHCGEEKGLWGSEYYVANPTVPLSKIVAQLNIDMIGRSKPSGDTKPANKVLTGPNEIYVVGSTLMSTDLQKASESVNQAFLKLLFNYKYDDPKDTERIFYRSDHYNYAKNGIPIIFYFDGVHEDYHRAGDEAHKIDYVKMAKVSQTVLATGFTLANAPTRPVVDKPLSK